MSPVERPPCRFERRRYGREGKGVICDVLCGELGWEVGFSPRKGEGNACPNACPALTEPISAKDLLLAPFMRRWIQKSLHNEIRKLDAPAFDDHGHKAANLPPLVDLFRRYAQTFGPEEAKDLLREARVWSARQDEDEGGLPVEEIRDRVRAMARDQNIPIEDIEGP